MSLISASKLIFEYVRRDKNGDVDGFTRAIDEIDLDVEQGDFVAIVGHNGCGKSTLAKHINALLHPTEGVLYVDGKDSSDIDNEWDIRRKCGMVFQNPENQMVATVIDEEVAFGPENLGIPSKEIWERVVESLKTVEMYEYIHKSPSKLSGGQKQRIAIAGVLAMHPKCIVLDEPTAMLDPQGRKEVIRAIRALNDVENITIILITHYMEEVIYADKVYVMDKGKVIAKGTPREIFSDADNLLEHSLNVPKATELAIELKKKGLNIPDGILDSKELVEAICRL